ncbi:DNA-binding response regulator [Paenibacillus sp. FSL H8-0548]|uniref:response regulator transcription factor n=1 Tax=Paenibacillus sp. FSL H8-0548 TaxID=1920422 RepID=UPI00096FC623|nr:response regulator [Paenibacillus sp. FSL H8-0548]OMF37734.1 DNA-binding response regulator [Paenibacillus sp. FSL H8-0548]
MRKMIIVDDEKNIRLGLKTMIEREFPESYEIRTAIHGEDALTQFHNERAEIMITDIRMPGIDGIELIKRLTSETDAEQKPIFIILSGYDDFAYAKAAIEYQVKDYLLKPIRRDELFESLRKSESTLQRQAEFAERVAVSDTYREQLRINAFKEWFRQDEPLLESKGDLETKVGFEQFTKPFTVAVLSYKSESGDSMNKEEFKLLVEKMLQPMEGVLNASFLDNESQLVLIGSPAFQFVELFRQAGVKELDGLRMGISSEGTELEELYYCYKQASEALQYSFIYSNCRLLRHEDIGEKRQYYPVPDEEIRKLGNMLGTDREREVQELLKQVFHTEDIPDVDIRYLRLIGKMINEQVLDEVFRIYGEESIEVLKLYRKVGSMDNFRSFHDYYRSLELLLSSVNDYVRGIRSAYSQHSDIKTAVSYMEENYFRPLNMAVVSNHVGLNYSYFSEAFKAHTGENFVGFLKKLRIRKGKELLLEGNQKMQEIGSAVGFENSKQFSRVFKELEGISPQEYRIKVRSDEGQSKEAVDHQV